MDEGRRYYTIGDVDVTADMLHIRYQSTTADAHGHGPLEAGAARLVAAEVLARYATDARGVAAASRRRCSSIPRSSPPTSPRS